jgi:eukaryotic-like serine/threonine-protein kinase
MGTVWEATEHRFDRPVAVKIQRKTDEHEMTVLREAMLLAKVSDPAIVRVIDYGVTVDGDPYFAMDLISGTTLSAVIRNGPMASPRALPIFRDIARGLAIAHEHGIVHRDIKPSNIMVDNMGRARILDFGIAMSRSEEEDPLEGSFAGSLQYASPEQVLHMPITPATDVHAFGLVLYHALTGHSPFGGEGAMLDLLERIKTLEVGAPSKRVPGIDGDLDALVVRCVQKDPKLRFADGHALMAAIEDLATGRRPSSVPKRLETHRPPRPSSTGMLPRNNANKTYSFEWRLRAKPSRLWPLVANTDQFNRAVGLPKPAWTNMMQDDQLVQMGKSSTLGMTSRWREYPFEWLFEREHRVFRKFEEGPLEALWNRVTLTKLEGESDGAHTLLRHAISVLPRSRLGALAASLEIEQRLKKSMQETYHRMDETVLAAGEGEQPTDPHAGSREPSGQERASIGAGIRKLAALGISRNITLNLERLLLNAPDMVVSAIRPKVLARDWAASFHEIVDALSQAARLQLLESVWDAICPVCRVPHERVTALASLKRNGECASCGKAFERDLAANVELVYRVHKDVRSAEEGSFCLGSPASRPHILFQQVLAPSEFRAVSVELARGAYLLTCHDKQAEIHVSPFGFAGETEVTVDSQGLTAAPGAVRSGLVTFSLSNDREHDAVVRLETKSARESAWSALEALSSPNLRLHCSPELIAPQEPLPVGKMAHLAVFVDWQYDRTDAARFGLMSRLDDLVKRSAAVYGGQCDGSPLARGAFIITFSDLLSAGKVATLLLSERRSFDGVTLHLGLHVGPGFVFARGEALEFFGDSIRRVEALHTGSDIALSDVAGSDPDLIGYLRAEGYVLRMQEVESGPFRGTRMSTANLDTVRKVDSVFPPGAPSRAPQAQLSTPPRASSTPPADDNQTRVEGQGATQVIGRRDPPN